MRRNEVDRYCREKTTLLIYRPQTLQQLHSNDSCSHAPMVSKSCGADGAQRNAYPAIKYFFPKISKFLICFLSWAISDKQALTTPNKNAKMQPTRQEQIKTNASAPPMKEYTSRPNHEIKKETPLFGTREVYSASSLNMK